MSQLRVLADEPVWPAAPALDREWLSRLDAKPEILDTIVALLHRRGWLATEDRDWLVLCLDEAVVNAMLHGNEGDPTLPIRVCVWADAARWTVLIADQGDGFDPATIPDQEDPGALLLEHGRGVRIMASWLDDLTYYRGGAVISMSRHRPANPSPVPASAP